MSKTSLNKGIAALITGIATGLFLVLAALVGSTHAAQLGAHIDVSSSVAGKTSNVTVCGAIGFSAPITATTGSVPSGAAASDFNRDGRLDLAISNYRGASGDSLSVLLGNGNGTLRAQSVYTTGAFPYSVVAADFNVDGRPDLAADNQTANNVAVRLGNGDGTVRSQTVYAVDTGPIGLVAGDFNSDGKPDLASANYYGNSVSVLLGNGDGTFRPSARFVAGSMPYDVAVADFNHDGRLDLVVANSGDANISVYLGNGDGTLRPQATFATGAQPRSVATGDFDGDGRPDIVVANYSSNNISLLRGNGDGTFQTQLTSGAGTGPQSVAVADFSGEGRLDVAVANFDAGTVSVLQGNGNGTFQPQAVFAAGRGVARVVTGDFNGDGRIDLATANSNDYTASILLNNCTSSGSPTVVPTATSAASSTPTTIPGDYNDVPPGSPFYSYVDCLTSHGVVGGYPCGGAGEPCPGTYFRPNNKVTRGQAAKIISLAAGYNDSIPANQQTFADVPSSSPFWLYVERIAAHGVINGYACGGTGEPCPGTYYRPGNNVTRGQLAKIDAAAAGYNDSIPANQQTFADVPSSSPFWVYVERVAMHRVISGYACGGTGEPCPGTYFRPGNLVTRGQTSKIVGLTFFPGCSALK